MVHAALLLLMLEAVNHGPRFTISLKRSTQKSSAIHKLRRPITPSLGAPRIHGELLGIEVAQSSVAKSMVKR
jgi:hypothetical protein